MGQDCNDVKMRALTEVFHCSDFIGDVLLCKANERTDNLPRKTLAQVSAGVDEKYFSLDDVVDDRSVACVSQGFACKGVLDGFRRSLLLQSCQCRFHLRQALRPTCRRPYWQVLLERLRPRTVIVKQRSW